VDHQDDGTAPLVILQRIANPAEVRRHRERGQYVVFEQNDDLLTKGSIFHIPHERETVAAANMVVTATRHMQRLYSRVNPNCAAMPEILEDEFWQTEPAQLPYSPLVLSWHGLGDNLQYVEPVIMELGAIPDFRLRIIMPERDSRHRSNRERVAQWPVPVDFVVWERDTWVREVATAHGGLVILPDTHFTRSKGSHKVLSYSALGLPCLASSLPQYREVIEHGKTGLLAVTPTEFREGIEQLRHAKFRRSIGEAAKKLSCQFTRKAVCDKWDLLLRQCLEERGR
jgi:hypothetical protein